MAAESLRELFVEELRDMYDGERRLTKALPQMARAATAEELREAINNHLQETEAQIGRLEQVFQALEEPVRAKTCHGIKGIVEEGKMAIDELEEGPLLDAAIIAGAQKVEHYEIASYGTLAFFAEILGESEAHDLLGESLEEEKAADEKLNEIAMSKVNREALQQSGDQEEEEDDEAQNQTGSSSRSGSRSGGQKSGARSSNRTGTRAASGRR